MTLMDHPENSTEYKGLTVNAGVENLPSVNPYATFRRKKVGCNRVFRKSPWQSQKQNALAFLKHNGIFGVHGCLFTHSKISS